MGFIGDHKKKIESMPAWEKYLDERKKKADEYMKQAEYAKREAEDLKKNGKIFRYAWWLRWCN